MRLGFQNLSQTDRSFFGCFLGFQVSGNAVTRQLAVFTVPHLTCVALQTYYVNAHRASRRYDDSRKEKLGAN